VVTMCVLVIQTAPLRPYAYAGSTTIASQAPVALTPIAARVISVRLRGTALDRRAPMPATRLAMFARPIRTATTRRSAGPTSADMTSPSQNGLASGHPASMNRHGVVDSLCR